MTLFNRKTLTRHIKPTPVPADHLAALDAWAEMIRSGRVYALKKTALHGQFAAKIIEGVLGYHGPAGRADYTVATEQTILRGSEALKVPRYNGGLFRQDDTINALTLPDDVCEGFKTLGGYDFASEVSVTVLGHIFEQSIADVERLQTQARGEEPEEERATGTTGRRKRDGVVYTPDYTAIPWRRKSAELEAWQAYRDRLKTLRIVDPACGSGVFLIMAFDFLKAELSRVNDKIAELQGKDRHIQDLLDPDSEILTNNLFGVDVNLESIEIAKLSLWIKTARRGKVLDSLSGNLRVGDSLIEDSSFAYLEVSDRADLYCYFFERGLRLLKPGGRLGFISSNTFFKTGSGKPLRGYLLREATIESVVDFGDLQIFEGVTTYPAILTMKRGAAPKGHELRFWKVEALPETNFQATWEKAAGPYPQAALGAEAVAQAQKVTLDEHDLARYEKTGYIRWESVLHFYSIDAVKAGFIRKTGGRWHLTDEGREALRLPPKELLDEAVRRYRAWKAERPTDPTVKPAELPVVVDEEEAVIATERAFVLETAESEARGEIEDFVTALGPYEFQELVAALLRGMGYATPHIAARGPDGGTDILAYPDPLGAKTPHVRVQVKHRKSQKATREEIAALRGIIRQDREIGLFVSSGGFTATAMTEARNGAVHIQLMDLDTFLESWMAYYDKLAEEDRALLRLRPVFFLAPN